MQTVLVTKAALVNAVVEGECARAAMCPATCSTCSSERFARSRPGFADAPTRIEDDDLIERLLRQARLDVDANRTSTIGAASSQAGGDRGAQTRARGARRALGTPAVERYRFASTTKPGVEYELTDDGADVELQLPRASSIAGSAVMRATSRRRSQRDRECRPDTVRHQRPRWDSRDLNEHVSERSAARTHKSTPKRRRRQVPPLQSDGTQGVRPYLNRSPTAVEHPVRYTVPSVL